MKKGFSIFFALTLLFTNVGASFSVHFCGGEAVKSAFSFGNKELNCGMMDMDSACERHSSPGLSAKDCCDNKLLPLSIDDDFNTSLVKSDIVSIPLHYTLFAKYSNLYFFDAASKVAYLSCSPPFLDQDIPVLIQSFLL